MDHHYVIQHQNFFSEGVVCPKPRRVDPIRHCRLHHSHNQEACDAKGANELLDIILAKTVNGGGTMEQQSASSAKQVASSPPFFNGSPPSRSSNPLVQDTRFVDEKSISISPNSISTSSGLASSPSSTTRKGGCMRVRFGNNPAVRVEGFDCLDRDRRVGRIPTLA